MKRTKRNGRTPAAGGSDNGEREQRREGRLTTGDVARLCGVTPKTIHSWVEKGLLPALRSPTGILRYERATLEPFLREYQYALPDVWPGETP